MAAWTAGLADDLVARRHIQGDLHSHTTYSDGTDPLGDMAAAGTRMGYRYLAVTDHAETTHVNSLSEPTLRTQREEIDAWNKANGDTLRLLQGVELDIGPDGSLPDLGGRIGGVDLVIVSLHSHFEMSRRAMTERVVKALGHPFVNIMGHPTARRLGTRPPVDMDLEEVFGAAAELGVALEINSTPTRLDLNADHIGMARRFGCMFSIDTDSHAASGLGRVELGLEVARKAGLTPGEVVNCLPLEELRSYLRKSEE